MQIPSNQEITNMYLAIGFFFHNFLSKKVIFVHISHFGIHFVFFKKNSEISKIFPKLFKSFKNSKIYMILMK